MQTPIIIYNGVNNAKSPVRIGPAGLVTALNTKAAGKVILFEKGTIELSYLLEMTDGADIEDISLKLEKPDCYHYGDYGCDCKVALFLESSRLESDEEYYKRVNNYLEKLNRKKNPEAKLKLKEKRNRKF